MKLYEDRASSNTRRILATAFHIGIDLEFQLVNLFNHENRQSEFLVLNPNGAIPAFVDEDIILYEASAIMIYLSEKFNSNLLPSGNARYQTLKWMFWAAEHFRYGPPILIEERFFKKIHQKPEDSNLIAFANKSIRRYSNILDEHMKHRRFVAAEHVTLADFDLASPFSHITRTQAPYDEFPNLMAWHQRLLDEVPAWKMTNEQLEIRVDEIKLAVGLA